MKIASSPTTKQSVGDPKTHMISPSRHLFRSSKNLRRRKTAARSSRNHHIDQYDISSSNSNSPYYKGLTDQSLAILDDAPTPTALHSHHHTTNYLLSSGHSPYYKGLTDYSLAIGPPTPPHLHNYHPSSDSSPSPYYRGLIDYSLALHPPSSPTTNSSIFSINFYSRFYIKGREDEELTAPPSSSIHADHVAFLIEHNNNNTLSEEENKMELMVEEEKPLRETESDPAIEVIESVLEENSEKTVLEEEMELMPCDDVELVIIQEKPLRERVSEAEIVLDKTVLEDDNIEMVIEEKPLRETDQASKVGINASLEEKTIVEGMTIEEKPLRERVSEESNTEKTLIVEEMDVQGNKEEELTSEKEKSTVLSVSEQTVESELGNHKLKEEKEKKDTVEEGNVYKEYVWATKYQPVTLEDFICNRDKALQLKALVKDGCACNHFIFEGPPNAGKRSMIRAMLREVFGADKVQVTEEYKNFNLKGEMIDNLQVRIKKSPHHVEVNLSETKGYEKHVIDDLFKDTYGKIINNSLPCSPENCQAIILYEAEKLSIESLLYIKWLLEKYKGCSKVFFCCSDESKLQPVKSLCTTFRLSSPSTEEIAKILEYIGKGEGIKLSRDVVEKITLRSKNNLRQAIRSLEATFRNKDILRDDDLILTGWEDDILNIAKSIIEEQSPRQLYVIRRKLRCLMIHDVPPDFIYKSLVAALTSLVDDSLQSGVAKLDKEYNKTTEIKFETLKQFGHTQNKALNYLKVEEFIAKFMSWYKNTSKKNNHVQLMVGTQTSGRS